MAAKSTSTRSTRRASAASKAAFDVVETLLVVQDGWLVRVDKAGKVKRKIKRIELPTE